MGNGKKAQVADAYSTTAAPSPLTAICPDLLGYACHLAWIYLFLYEPGTPSNVSIPGLTTIYLVSALALATMFLLGSVRTRSFMRFAESRVARIAAPVLTSTGTLLYCLPGLQTAPTVVWASGITTGIGSALLAARWASIWGNVSPRQVVENFPVMLTAIIIAPISLSYLPAIARTVLVAALPLLSGLCLSSARNYQRKLVNVSPQRHRGRASKTGASAVKLHIFIAPIALVAPMSLLSGALESLPQIDGSALSYGSLFYGAAAVVVLVYVGLSLVQVSPSHFVVLFCVPLATLFAVLLPFVQSAPDGLASVLYPIGSISFELILLFGAVMFALAKDVSPARSFMVARCTRATCDLLGYLAGGALAGILDTATGLQIASVTLFVGSEALVATAVLLYFTAKRLTGREEHSQQAASAPAHISGKMPRGNSEDVLSVQVNMGGESGVVHEPAKQSDPCVAIADKYGLSERELEIMQLLSQGKTPVDIQRDLCIAQGTVNYHLRNIYSKIGVHSRQELLVLIFGAHQA